MKIHLHPSKPPLDPMADNPRASRPIQRHNTLISIPPW
jgi:hypothetical protein